MDKLKLLLLYKSYPFTMANYFRRALERRDDIELFTGGDFYGQWIPWNGGMEIPNKYYNQVDLPLPRNVNKTSWDFIVGNLPWKPDLVLNVDAGFHLTNKPDVPYAVVLTDPHVLSDWYAEVRPIADYVFNMQPSYMQTGDYLLPYAFDKEAHYPISPEVLASTTDPRGYKEIPKEYDCCMVGLHYPHRDEWVQRLRNEGITVNYRIGDIYDEYREENNKANIGLIWSSREDVIARVFEVMAMRMTPVMNRLSGLDYLGFEDGRHYLGFSTMEEAVAQVKWAKEHPDFAHQIAHNAYQFVHERNCTWDARCTQILKETKLVV